MPTISSTLLAARERVLERGDAGVAVAADDLHEQPLLRAEVVVQQPARDAGLARDDVEGRAGGAAGADALAHRGDDPLRLLAVELARGFYGRGFHGSSLAGRPARRCLRTEERSPVRGAPEGALVQSRCGGAGARRRPSPPSPPGPGWWSRCTRTPPRIRTARRGPSSAGPRSGRVPARRPRGQRRAGRPRRRFLRLGFSRRASAALFSEFGRLLQVPLDLLVLQRLLRALPVHAAVRLARRLEGRAQVVAQVIVLDELAACTGCCGRPVPPPPLRLRPLRPSSWLP